MNNKIKNTILPLLFSLLFVVGVVTMIVRAASPVSLYLTPSSQTVSQGNSFSVGLRVNSQGNAVDYARAYLNFPSDRLSVAGISAAGSGFDYQLEASVSGNQIKVTRYSTTGAKNGDLLVATITFTTISTGTASVGFDAGSAAYYTAGGSNQPVTTLTGGSYAVTAPVQPSPQPVSRPIIPPGPTPAPPTAPVATVSPASKPVITPGSSSTNIPSVGASTAVMLPFIPEPGQDKQAASYPVVITIKDHASKPVTGAEVRVGTASVLTNSSGAVSALLPAGEQIVYVKSANLSKQFTIKVEPKTSDADATTPAAQEFSLLLPKSKSGASKPLIIGLGVVCAVAILAVLALSRKHPKSHRARRRARTAVSSSVTGTRQQPVEPLTLTPVEKAGEAPAIILAHASHAKVHQLEETPAPKKEHKPAATTSLHPHDEAKTMLPVSPDLKPSIAHASVPKTAVTELDTVPIPGKVVPPEVATSATNTPKPPRAAPPKVEPYGPNGEPKDIFEMAEERFKNDDRLKDLR